MCTRGGKDDLDRRLAFVRLGLHVRAIAIVHQILQQVLFNMFTVDDRAVYPIMLVIQTELML